MIRIVVYNTVHEVPSQVWEQFVSRKIVGLEIKHLQAIEESQINDIHPYYMIGYKGSVPIGIAYCFSMKIDLARLVNLYPQNVIETVKIWKPGFMEMKIIEVGHIASLGKTIEVLPPFMNDFIYAFNTKLNDIAQSENAELCLIRDIETANYKDISVVECYGFCPFMGFPIARMPIRWNTFDAYLGALKAKKRYNFLKKREKLSAPEITLEIIEDYAPYSKRLSELWTNVAIRQNGYEHERLTPIYFEKMSEHMKGRSHVAAIKLNGEIVAYGLNLLGDEELFGVAEGMDYNYRDTYDLYANNMFEGIRIACETGKKSINIGVTAYDYKTSIGAEIEPCVYFIKSFQKQEYSKAYADLIRKNIQQPLIHHRVFREEKEGIKNHFPKTANILEITKNHSDIFEKLLSNTRTDCARAADLYTYCPVFESAQEPVIQHKNRNVIMLGSNAYLGLATHPKIKSAAIEAINKYGSGCSGSPMLNGTLDLHQQLTQKLANFMKKQEALVFSTGYQTNLGVLSAIANRNDVIILDERNHASLVDGALLSRATLVRYKHNNIESLETMLMKYADKPKLVVTDTLFSMEGTIINLPEVVRLSKLYNARILLDESHAIGVMGPTGRGIAEQFGLTNEIDLITGTFSKSLASIGGFVAGDKKIIDSLQHTSRSHIFSASLPPASIAAVLAAIEIIDNEPERRKNLIGNARFLATGLKNLGYTIDYHDSAIIALHCNHELLALTAYQKLFDAGVFVNPVVAPAVPKNREILRISLMATHTEEVLANALKIFKSIKTPFWPCTNQEKIVEISKELIC